MHQLKETRKLTSSPYPPLNWVTCIKIFCWEFKILFQFIDRVLVFLAILSSEGFLRGAIHGCLNRDRRQQWHWAGQGGIMFIKVLE